MNILINNKNVAELSELQKKVICNDLDADIFELDMMRRVKYILTHKYDRCMMRLRKEWEPKLAQRGIESIPVSNDTFAELVFSQADYKGKKEREMENPMREELIVETKNLLEAYLAQ